MANSDKFHEECGVVAIYAHPEAEKLAYLGLHALQHRGQESAGIVTSDGMALHTHKAMGLVADIFVEQRVLQATQAEDVLQEAQLNGKDIEQALIDSGFVDHRGFYQVIADALGTDFIELAGNEIAPEAMADALRRVEGAFSLVMVSADRVFAARDPRGFRPLAMGRIPAQEGVRKDTIVFASETCAFDLIGAVYERDVKPGELVIVGPEGVTSRFYSPTGPQSSCIFEHVYFSRPDSQVFGRSVQISRENLGKQLAREAGVEADVVVPVPDSGVTAGVGYAAESGIPFRFGLIRNHYVGRTFIEPKQTVRDFGVRLKLNPVRSLLEGKRVVLIDDSIVRGTTSKKIVRMVRNAGAAEVHMRISCPPTISPCFYGVDTPSKNQLIGANKSVEEIREYIGADSLAYLSLEGLKKACGEGEKTDYCTACYTGKYPTNWVDVEEIQTAGSKR